MPTEDERRNTYSDAASADEAVASLQDARASRAQDLRATTDSIRADIDRLDDLEKRKQQLAPEDPEVDELSEAAATVAERLSQETRAERQLGQELR